MEESKNSVADIVPIVSKITEHKLNGSNYIEWSKTIKIYLRSVAKDDHLTEEPPNDHTRKLWMQDDARLFLQMKNSINSDIKSAAGIILLVVYVDDIVITGNDHAGISDLKTFMHSKFHTKDLGELKYFLGIEVSRSKKGMFLSQRKYVLDLLKETGKIEAKPCTTRWFLMYNLCQMMEILLQLERYRRVVGKLNYLTVTRPDIAYAISVVSRFTSAPTIKHWAALERFCILYSSQGHTRIECFSDADWAGSKFDRRSTTGYCVFFGGNLVAWKSKKQSVVSRSSAESEYRAMAQATCEIIWIHQLLCEVGMKCTMPAKLWCDNQAALHIVVDCHFIREKIEENLVSTGYVKTGEQLGDIFTKALNGTRVEYFCNKS
ncbi:hypothetical protein AAG906_020180 [Vitis piasezkii]